MAGPFFLWVGRAGILGDKARAPRGTVRTEFPWQESSSSEAARRSSRAVEDPFRRDGWLGISGRNAGLSVKDLQSMIKGLGWPGGKSFEKLPRT